MLTHQATIRRLVCALVPGLLSASALGLDEYRAMWVTHSEWPKYNEADCKAYIDDVMADLKAANFNTVIFQMRDGADTLYPSPFEPWSPLISIDGSDPGWDPMAYAINAAHTPDAQGRTLEFHAHINTHVSWQYAGRPDETGIIVDNTDAGFTVLSGTWTSDTISTAWPVPGGTYLYRSAAPGGTAQVQWQTTVPVSDYYEIHVWIPNLICCTQVQYIVDSPDDPGATSQTVNISQSAVHGDDGGWGLIGRPAYFVAGTTATVRLSNNSTCGTVVVADAVRFRRASPSAANHLFWQHCNMADPAHRDWLICNGNNAPIGLEEGNYAWMAPGIPDWAAYARKQIMYVVTQYDGSSPSRPRLDGVHFDHIRTPNNGSFPTQHWSYDPVSLARSGSSEANPAGLAWADWMRDQTNRFVQDIYAEILELRPDLRVSAAPLGLYADNRYPPEYPDPCVLTYGYSCAYQDTQNWLSRGAMDFIIPMIYWADGGSDPDFGEVAPDWVTNRAGRHVVAGQAAFKLEFTLAAMSNQVSVMRTLGGHGTCPFSYATFKYWTQYVAAGGPFEQTASIPAMTWKTTPTSAVILGNVTEIDGITPIVDANVTRNPGSPPFTALTSGDGLYSFLQVPAGMYTLTWQKGGYLDYQVSGLELEVGDVARVDVSMLVSSAAATIRRQPVAQSSCPGGTATFSVSAGGTGTLVHHWYKGDEPLSDGDGIAGATTARLTLSNVQSSQAGGYRCLVSNSGGDTSSSTVQLTVRPATEITDDPDTVTNVCPGDPVQFTVSAAGEGTLVYQWLKDGSPLTEASPYSGVTSTTLTVSPVGESEAGSYACRVSGDCGIVTSQLAALVISPDGDFDGFRDCVDNCPTWYNPDQADADSDGDGDVCDNCPTVFNPDQSDGDFDEWGDLCDNCPFDWNYDQVDSDIDNVGDDCDNCQFDANYDQADTDSDGPGDVCDGCATDPMKTQPGQCGCNVPDTDNDWDGHANCIDNCPDLYNPDQEDGNSNGIGNVCEEREAAAWYSYVGASLVPMPLNGTSVATESRRGDVPGVSRLDIVFNGTDAITPYALALIGVWDGLGGAHAFSAEAAGNTVTLTFGTPLADGCYYVLIPPSAIREQLIGDADCQFRYLAGDTTGNGTVNLGDALYVKSKIGQFATDYPNADVNLTDVIDLDDVVAARGLVISPATSVNCP